jgi:hypothetical protein
MKWITEDSRVQETGALSFKSESEVLHFPASAHADGRAIAPTNSDEKQKTGPKLFHRAEI